jgi:hypothetical protein
LLVCNIKIKVLMVAGEEYGMPWVQDIPLPEILAQVSILKMKH